MTHHASICASHVLAEIANIIANPSEGRLFSPQSPQPHVGIHSFPFHVVAFPRAANGRHPIVSVAAALMTTSASDKIGETRIVNFSY